MNGLNPHPKRSAATAVRTPSRLRRFISGQKGSAIAEMAFGLPILLMVLTGIFSFSIVLFQKLQLAEAISVGGRYIAVDRGDNDPCKSTASKIYAAAPGLSQSSLSLTFTLNGVATNGATCPGSGSSANANMVSGANAQITASYPCSLNFFPAFGHATSMTCSLKSSVVEIVQ